MVIDDDIRNALMDLVDLLDHQNIPFVVIGGLAVLVHGEPRYTADVDVVVGIDIPTAIEFLAALEGSPFSPLFDDPEQMIGELDDV